MFNMYVFKDESNKNLNIFKLCIFYKYMTHKSVRLKVEVNKAFKKNRSLVHFYFHCTKRILN